MLSWPEPESFSKRILFSYGCNMPIYEIDCQDHIVRMKVDKTISRKRLKGVALKFLQNKYGPEIYRGGDIASIKLKEEE